eukprot:TRINITY_DN56482_c0_g1_i1.p1 TRINITY_DN56482_c0_g1~~TRINITY_DN56482_c0_g1_i1.p1  ORF type:complete len:285 (+),score=77.97 TRINITY_DN56482_c0_g1_i1:107-961(+)
MIRQPPRSTLSSSSAASDVYKRQEYGCSPMGGDEDEVETLIDHGHSHAHSRPHEKRNLLYALGLTLAFTAVELVAALATKSVVLAMDALHHTVDVAAIIVALVAIELSSRPVEGTFGKRYTDDEGFEHSCAELAASLGNALLLLVLTAILMAESVVRLAHPEDETVSAWLIIVMAVLSAVLNVVKMWLLHGDAMKSMNVRAIYVHVIADGFASLGALMVGIWMMYDPDNRKVEPIVTLAIGAVIVLNTLWVLTLIHISEPTRLLSISYAVFCLKKKKKKSKKIK